MYLLLTEIFFKNKYISHLDIFEWLLSLPVTWQMRMLLHLCSDFILFYCLHNISLIGNRLQVGSLWHVGSSLWRNLTWNFYTGDINIAYQKFVLFASLGVFGRVWERIIQVPTWKLDRTLPAISVSRRDSGCERSLLCSFHLQHIQNIYIQTWIAPGTPSRLIEVSYSVMGGSTW